MAEMTDAPLPAGTPPGAKAGRPRGKQLLILLGAGSVLAFGGCALFLGTLNINESGGGTDLPNIAGAILFGAGALMFVIGLIVAFVVVLQKIVDRQKG